MPIFRIFVIKESREMGWRLEVYEGISFKIKKITSLSANDNDP